MKNLINRSLFRACLLWAACCLIVLGSGVAFAGPSAADTEAQAQLKAFVDDMLSLIRETPEGVTLASRKDQLHDRAMKMFDFSTFSMLSLGAKYRSFSDAQKEAFTQCFSQLICNTYVAKLEGQRVDNIQIEYDDPMPLAPKRDTLRSDVPSRIIQEGVPIPVIYRMIKRGDGEWKIYDVKIEGVSMAANYREQFRQAVNDSPEKIINDIKEKLKE